MKADLKFDPEFKNQKEMFLWIWDNRPHVSELTGKPLLYPGNSKWHWQFLHVLPKGAYPAFKLNQNNVLLGLPDEHEKQNEFNIFNEKYENLQREYYRDVYGKEFE